MDGATRGALIPPQSRPASANPLGPFPQAVVTAL